MHATPPFPGPLRPSPERRGLAPWQRYGSWLLASLCLVGCGGGSEGSSEGGGLSNPVAPGVVEPLAGPAVRVEVSPVALLLTDNGQQQRLSVRAFDQDGREVKTAVTWEALRPAQVGVAADGTVRANTAVGSGQVVAIVDGVRSASVVVSVVQLAPGVTLINDAQIGSVPVAVDPLAEPDTDNPYEVLLIGIAAPAPGTLLLGREGRVIGGEVIESRVEAGGVRVRLKTVSIDRRVVAAEIQEEIDLKGLPCRCRPTSPRCTTCGWRPMSTSSRRDPAWPPPPNPSPHRSRRANQANQGRSARWPPPTAAKARWPCVNSSSVRSSARWPRRSCRCR